MKDRLFWHNRWFRASMVTVGVLTVAAMIAPEFVSAAADKALDILEKSVKARGEVTYSGVATVTRIRDGKTRRWTQTVHRQKGGRERVKLQDADGKLIVLRVSDGKTLWEHHPTRGRVYERTLPDRVHGRAKDLYNLKILGRNFQVTLQGTDVIAGRKAHHIRIGHPGPPPIIIREVWIDQQTFTELKTRRYGNDNQPVHTVALERINFAPQFPPGTFEFHMPPNIKSHVVKRPKFQGTVQEAGKEVGFKAMPPPHLPDGFALYTNSVTVGEFKGVPVLWFQHTNGIRAFSVFQRRAAQQADQRKPGRGGARTIRIGEFHFTIVGPLKTDEFKIITDGYKQAP